MNTNHVMEIIMVAKLASITAAAKTLFISPSSITKHIQHLEKELGFNIFERNTHHIKLTEKGRYFIDQAEPCINTLHSLFAELSGSSENRLRLVVNHSNAYKKLYQLIELFQVHYPEVKVTLSNASIISMPDILEKDEADIIIGLRQKDYSSDSFCSVTIDYVPLLLAGPAELVQDSNNLIELLKKEKLIIADAKKIPGVTNVLKILKESNPEYEKHLILRPDIESILMEIAVNKGFALLPANYSGMIPDGIKLSPIDTLPAVPLIASWKKDNKNPFIPKFLALLQVEKEAHITPIYAKD